jgi:general secretion pathway protein G
MVSQKQKVEGGRQKAVERTAHCPLPTAHCHSGFTLIELIITLGILAILVAGALPLARNTNKRERERQLRYHLRDLRRAIDRYHYECLRGAVGPLDRKVDDECYPPNLEILVEGITPPNTTNKIRFLRRLPVDPMTGKSEWNLRSIQDDKDASSWGGQNVYDIYSKSEGTALNGTKYKDW